MDIVYLLKVLWRKKWIILAVSAISSLAAYYFTLNLPKRYRAISQIATGFTTNEGISVTNERFTNQRDMDLNFSNLLNTLNSGNMTNLLSYRLTLHDVQDPSHAFRRPNAESRLSPSVEEIKFVIKHLEERLAEKTPSPLSVGTDGDALIRFMEAYGYGYNPTKASLKISRVPNTDFIQIEYVSENPTLSTFAVNSFCEEFLRTYAASKTERSGESVEFFEQLVKQKKTELDEKSETLKTFKATNSLVNIEIDSESKLAQEADLDKQRDEINSTIYGLRLTLDKLRGDLNRGGGSANGTNETILRLRSQINSLNDRYISSGSSNQELLDSLNQLRERYRVETTKLAPGDEKSTMSRSQLQTKIAETDIQLSIEESKLNSVNAKLRNLKGSISSFASKEGALTALTREVEVATSEYLDAVNRYNEARNKALISAGSIRQVSKAIAVPEASKRAIIIGLAGFTTFIVAAFVIVLIEVFDSSIRTPAQFERTVKLPLAGFLIRVNVKKLDYNTLFAEKLIDEELETFKHFLRKVRFEIESLKAKCLLVTSTRKEAGKSFTIFSLAFVLSLVNKRVLIIDTNFKNNSLTRSLTKSPEKVKLLERKGDSDLKLIDPTNRKKTEPEPDNNSMIMPTKYRNIFIIGNAGGYDSPEEILSGRDFGSLINTMKESFDYILLEGAALNDFSDSKELVRYVDMVIPVFSADASIGQLDSESITFLKGLGKKLGGAILNNVDFKNLKI